MLPITELAERLFYIIIMHNWQTSFFPIFYRLDQTCFGPLSVCVCVCALHQLYLFAAAMLYVCMHGIPPFGVCVCLCMCVCVWTAGSLARV